MRVITWTLAPQTELFVLGIASWSNQVMAVVVVIFHKIAQLSLYQMYVPWLEIDDRSHKGTMPTFKPPYIQNVKMKIKSSVYCMASIFT
jgi:hypothetical protein